MSDFVAPAYHDRSLGDVLPAVAAALGVDAGFPSSSLRFPAAQGYVVFLVDGLGYELLKKHASHAPYLASLVADSTPGTVGVPTTTATSLTSFGTALTPGTHGVVGFTSRIPGTDELLNALMWSKNVDPAEWQPHPTAFSRLAAAGVHAAVVNKREFVSSGLTLAGSRGAEYVGADRLGERAVAVVSAAGRTPSVTYMYDGDLDWTGHRYGVDSPQWRAQLEAIDVAAEHLREVLPPSVRLVVVADHGMVDSPAESRIEVDDHPELREGVALLGGEARFRHVYCRGGAVDDVLQTWRGFLGERALVLSRDEALAEGWFGELTPQVRPRLGDVVVACRDDHAIISTTDFPYENILVGMHGSLTSAEMLIPILVD
ncbi:MAG TPA: alkaline phosphatase family protein [Nocardioidaceae bacterium]|nr:alkaline phosphatase family protein [Nocardioidaceae bacterium]